MDKKIEYAMIILFVVAIFFFVMAAYNLQSDYNSLVVKYNELVKECWCLKWNSTLIVR